MNFKFAICNNRIFKYYLFVRGCFLPCQQDKFRLRRIFSNTALQNSINTFCIFYIAFVYFPNKHWVFFYYFIDFPYTVFNYYIVTNERYTVFGFIVQALLTTDHFWSLMKRGIYVLTICALAVSSWCYHINSTKWSPFLCFFIILFRRKVKNISTTFSISLCLF